MNLKCALARLLPRIHALNIPALISETPYLSALQRDFYTHYLTARREKVFA